MCDEQEEAADHLLFDCPAIARGRYTIFDSLGKSGEFPKEDLISCFGATYYIAGVCFQGLIILGDEIAAHRVMFRFDKTLQVEERVSRSDIEAEERTSAEEDAEATSDATTEETKTEETKTGETETTDEKTSEESSIDVFEDASDHPNDVKSSITRDKIKREDKLRRHSDPIKKSPGSPQKKRNRIVSAPVEETVVNVMTDDDQLSPFTERSKYPRRGKTKEKDVRKGSLLDNQTISLEELQKSEDAYGSSDGSPMVGVRTADNFIRVPRDWRKRQVKTQTSTPYIGIIQNTSAYRNIENELKFLPEKFKDIGKYEIVNKMSNISNLRVFSSLFKVKFYDG
ncbi:hypothetical protein J6590_078717 [Homalodisca vitripennis]|nr:hypothetical protein J6590_078717 [Homalodisca vitripennis]